MTVNGERRDLADGLTLAGLLAQTLSSTKGVAVALDGTVAPRTTWADVVLRDGQAVELLTAVQGG
jgi:sulfur carrier protein